MTTPITAWAGTSLDPSNLYKQGFVYNPMQPNQFQTQGTGLFNTVKSALGFDTTQTNWGNWIQNNAGNPLATLPSDALQFAVDNKLLQIDNTGKIMGLATDKNGAQNMAQLTQLRDNIQTQFNNGQWTTKDTFGAIGAGINAVTNLYGMYNAHQQLKLGKQALAEQTALNRANFRNTAKTLNSQYRDQASGRGYVGMDRQARSALGRLYKDRKLEETY